MTIDTAHPVENPPLRWGNACMLGICTFLFTLFCLHIMRLYDQISPLWFSTALMSVIIFRLRGAQLFLTLMCCILGIITAKGIMFRFDISNFIYATLNLVQAVLAGGLLRLLLDPLRPLSSLAAWWKMALAACLFAPLLSGLLAITVLQLTGDIAARFYTTWVLSEIIGNLALVPVALLWRNDYLRHRQQNALFETLATLCVTLLLNYVALHYLPSPFTFVVVILFWSAVRLPQFEAFAVFLANLLVMSLQLSVHNTADDDLSTSTLLLTAPWLPFLLSLIPCHIMTLVMYSVREEKKHISESETRFRHAMEYSAIGMALVAPDGKWLQVNKSLCRLLGYATEQITRLNFQQVTHPDDLDADLRQLTALLQGEIDNYTMEKRYLHRDGHIVWALLAVSLVRNSDGQPLYFIAQIEDITELKHAEQVNQRLMERITLANEAGGIGVWEWNVLTGEMNWDKRMYEIYELNTDAVPDNGLIMSRVIDEDRELLNAAIAGTLTRHDPLNVEYRIHSTQGLRFLRVQANAVLNHDGNVARMLGIAQDVSQLRQLNDALFQEKERMHITLDAIGEAVISTDKEMRVIFMNPVAEKMSGWLQEAAEGKALSTILHITHGRNGPAMENLLLCDLPIGKSTPTLEEELVLHSKSGEQYDIEYSITPLKTLNGQDIGTVMVINDASASREMIKRLSYSATHDMLTRLPNRMNFELQMKHLLLSASESGQQHVLAFIDLDRFKAVNDNAGHAAGDALLRELADIMRHSLRRTDFLARLGGDEFGVLLPDCPLDKAREVIQRIVSAVNEHRFLWEGRLYRVGASAGITRINAGNLHAGDVLTQADLACYSAKHNGRGQIAVYEKRLLKTESHSLTRQDVEQILCDQPLRLHGWAVAPPRIPQSTTFWLTELQLFSAQGHDIDESTFRSGLEDIALLVELDRKVIHAFFQHYASGVIAKGLTVTLPLSNAGLRDMSLIDALIDMLARYHFPANQLVLVIHLDTLLSDDEQIHHSLQQLKMLGCKVLLKEFGRNLEVFSQLHVNEVDYLMLSPDLVANVHCNLMDEMMVSIIHGHAQRLNIATLAGPIELPVALNTLANIGIEGVWGPAIGQRESLNSLISDGYFAIK